MNVLDNQKIRKPGTLLDDKILKQEDLEGGLLLKVTINKASERIFVEFSSSDGKLVVQRSYPDSFAGQIQADIFKVKFKSLTDLKTYLKFK